MQSPGAPPQELLAEQNRQLARAAAPCPADQVTVPAGSRERSPGSGLQPNSERHLSSPSAPGWNRRSGGVPRPKAAWRSLPAVDHHPVGVREHRGVAVGRRERQQHRQRPALDRASPRSWSPSPPRAPSSPANRPRGSILHRRSASAPGSATSRSRSARRPGEAPEQEPIAPPGGVDARDQSRPRQRAQHMGLVRRARPSWPLALHQLARSGRRPALALRWPRGCDPEIAAHLAARPCRVSSLLVLDAELEDHGGSTR